MGRFIRVIAGIILISTVSLTSVYAQWWWERKTPEKEKGEQQPQTQRRRPESRRVTSREREARIKAINKAKERINNIQWEIEMTPLAGGRTRSDVLIFSENKFSSQKCSSKGFPTTNYTVSLEDDGTIVWETMQSKENGEIVFWKGEITPNLSQMTGVTSYQRRGEPQESYSFQSIDRESLAGKRIPRLPQRPPVEVEKEPRPPQEEEAIASQPPFLEEEPAPEPEKKEEKKKRKKRRFLFW